MASEMMVCFVCYNINNNSKSKHVLTNKLVYDNHNIYKTMRTRNKNKLITCSFSRCAARAMHSRTSAQMEHGTFVGLMRLAIVFYNVKILIL